MKFSNFQKTLQKYLVPISLKLEKQKHIQAIKDGMISIVPVIIIGSFCLLPLALKNMLPAGALQQFLIDYMDIYLFPTTFTTNVVSLYAAFGIADSLARAYKLNSRGTPIVAIVIQLILCGEKIEGGIGIANLGAEGIFVSMISAILVVEVTRFMKEKKLVIKMPESVPSMVADSMSSLFPVIVSVIIATTISMVCLKTSGMQFPKLVMSMLAPAIQSIDTLPAVMLIIFLTQLLWFLGLHGQAIVGVIWGPFALTYATENIAAYAAGLPATHVFTDSVFFTMLSVTGSGLTLGLVILMMMSKAKSFKAVGKAAVIPSIFGINEPVIFGVPIVMNPFLFVPFVFGPVLIAAIDFLAIKYGFVGMAITQPPGFLPPGVGAFLMTMDYRAPILVLLTLVLMAVIYYPFFKVMEANELKKELEEEKKLA